MKIKSNYYVNFGHKYDGDYYCDIQPIDLENGKSIRHAHDSFEIAYQTKGQRTYIINDRTIELQTGDVIIIPPGVEHYTLTCEEPFEAYVFGYIPEIIYSYELSFRNIKYLLAFGRETPLERCIFRGDSALLCELRQEIEKLISYDNQPDMELPARANIIRIHYLAYCLSSVGQSESASELISAVNRCIEDHFDEEISPYFIADQLHISHSYLCHRLKAELGCTPSELIMRYRLGYAENLLIYRRDLSVTEIGVKVGIPDTSYFIKCFRRSRGMTPNKFREMNTRKI